MIRSKVALFMSERINGPEQSMMSAICPIAGGGKALPAPAAVFSRARLQAASKASYILSGCLHCSQ